MSERTRAYIYRVGTAVGGLLVFYGVLSESELAAWLQALGAALLVGEGSLAAVKTSTRKASNGGGTARP